MFNFNGEKRNYNRRYPEDYGFIRTLWITIFLYFVVWPAAFIWYTAKIEGWNNIDRKKLFNYYLSHADMDAMNNMNLTEIFVYDFVHMYLFYNLSKSFHLVIHLVFVVLFL